MRAIILSHLYLDPAQRGKLRALAGQGVTLVAAVPGGLAGEDGSVRLAPIPVRGDPADPERLRWNRAAIRRLLTEVRPSLLQIEEEPATQAAAVAASEAVRLGIPVVLFSWDGLAGKPGFAERRRAGKTLAASKGVIGGNRPAADSLKAAAPGIPVLCMPQTGIALPPPPLQRSASNALSIGYVGRLIPERAVDTLLRGCAMVMGNWTLTVAGTGPEQEPLEELAQRLGLASRIHWLGGVSRAEVEALWPTLDCLVLPSRSEGWTERWSGVLVDAMARGVVPVVSQGSTLHAVVEEAGCAVGDEESLGMALQSLLAYPDERRRLGAAARQRVLEHYVDSAIADRTLALWRHVAAGDQ